MTLHLAAGAAHLILDPASGGRAVSLVVDGHELLVAASGAAAPVSYGMYVMAPWPGRLRDNVIAFEGERHRFAPNMEGWAIHGLVLDRTWEVERVGPHDGDGSIEAVLGIDLAEPWPWPGRLRATWRLGPHSLATTLAVESGGASFPVELGWHPWFRRRLDDGPPVQVELPGDSMLQRGPDHLPTGRTLTPRPPGPYDDAFALPGGTAALVWPGVLRLELTTDCPYVVLFDELEPAVCLEPQTAAPDGINAGPGLAKAGCPRTACAVWSWRPDAG